MRRHVDQRFAGRLREWRLARGLSVRELAKRAHVAKSTISDLEHGKKTPGVETVHALDRALGAGGELTNMIRDVPDARTKTTTRFVSTGTAARELGVDSATVWRWQRRGTITPAWVTPGGHARWDMTRLREQLRMQGSHQ